jgi:uncharacterized protein
MEKNIPEHIDPFRYAEQDLRLDGTVKVADMARLCAHLSQTDTLARAELHFGVDEQRVTFVKGQVKANLVLHCQRCMQPYSCEIMSDFAVGIAKTLDEANALPAQYEPALTIEGQLALRELIEDELILNLPIIPRHELDECQVKLPLAGSGWKEGETNNPFQVLASLKQKSS